eukprot:536891_1
MKRRSTGFVSTIDKDEHPEPDESPLQSNSCWKSKAVLYPLLFLVFIFVFLYAIAMKQSSQTQILLVPESYPPIHDDVIDTSTTTVQVARQNTNPPKLTIQPTQSPIKPTHPPTKTDTDLTANIFIYPRGNAAANISDFPPTLQSSTYYSTGGKGECNCPVPQHVPKYSAVQYDKQRLLKPFKQPSFDVSLVENNTVGRVRSAWHEYQIRSSNNNSCRSGFGMWAPFTKPGYHKCMARNVGYAWRLKPGDIVLDMGSGCGHTLLQWVYWYGVFGVGFDWQKENVLYSNDVAMKNGLNAQFYQASIQSIYLEEWIPNESFDYIHTNAVLMYLDPPTACLVIQKTIQILKVNGSAWFGWNKGGMMTRGKLDMCMESFANVNQKNINVTWFDRSQMKELMDTCQKSKEYPSFMIQRTA